MNSSSAITTDVEYAARLLNDGGVIGMPTETVYGLAARADKEHSVGRIFDIKGRPRMTTLKLWLLHFGQAPSPCWCPALNAWVYGLLAGATPLHCEFRRMR